MVKVKVVSIVTFISLSVALITAGLIKLFFSFTAPGFWLGLLEFVFLETFLIYGFMGCRAPIFGRVRWRGPRKLKVISITFDDGPNEPYTSQVLDILRRFEVKATFFVIGQNVERFSDLVRQEVQEGHEVGNHTFNHQVLPFRSWAYIRNQIKKTSDLIQELTGTRPRLFRAPHGWRTPGLNRIAQEEGCIPVAWSTGVRDTSSPGSEIIIKRCLNGLRNGGILLLHDGRDTNPTANCKQLIEALPVVIKKAKQAGYSFLKLSEMLQLEKKAVNPGSPRPGGKFDFLPA